MRIDWLTDKRYSIPALYHYRLIVLGMTLLAMVGLMSCEEYKEGCMDASATNFKVSNQLPCCCEYPKIIFQTTLTDGKKTLPFSDTFTNEIGQQYLIRNFRFIASDITLTDSLDITYKPVDTFNNYIIPADILAANVLDLNSTGANFMHNGTFDHLYFSIDRVGELDSRIPKDFPLDHPLRDSSFYDFSKNSWILIRAVIEIVDKGLISLNLPNSELPATVSVPGRWTKNRGQNLTVNFRVNISTLFSDMDFSLPPEDLMQEFKTNLPFSFEL